MSEQHYYEFAALDRPLTAEEQEELRAISPRFEVDSHGLKCFHSLDELKVDPKELVARYFDAYFYASNWGGYTLMFRFPRRLVDLERLNLYENGDTFTVSVSGEFCLVRFRVSSIVDTYGELRMEKGEYLPVLVPLRSDILRGDLRCLYLSWLQDIMALYGEMEFKEQPKRRVRIEEPPVPSGLNELTPALKTFIDLFDISRDLVAVAAERSAPLYQAPFTNEPPRTVAELLDQAGRHGEERGKREA